MGAQGDAGYWVYRRAPRSGGIRWVAPEIHARSPRGPHSACGVAGNSAGVAHRGLGPSRVKRQLGEQRVEGEQADQGRVSEGVGGERERKEAGKARQGEGEREGKKK